MKNNARQPHITVVIPTRERSDTLEKCMQTVVAQDYPNLTIIVSDNFSQDNTEEVVRSFCDSRIIYLNTNRRLSMSHNWEFALSNIEDGWVTILGDDDGLLPNSVDKVAKVIEDTNILAIRSRSCSYAWPAVTGKEFGHLDISLKSTYEVRDSKAWLSKVMNGNAHYPELPMLYNGGFINISVLKEIKEKSGSIYRSCNPDVYSAIAITSSVNNYMFMEEPLALNGASRHSTGTSHFSKNNVSEQSAAQKFLSEGNIAFHEDIPVCSDGKYPLSIQAMVYEAYRQSAILRLNDPLITPSQQLEVIISTAGVHNLSVTEWASTFAAFHRLNLTEICSSAEKKKRLRTFVGLPERISRAFTTYSVGSATSPIVDVYQASLVAADILDNKPNIIQRMSNLADRVATKLNS